MFNYKVILPNYIAHGKPSEDTLKSYTYEIDNWLNYCKDNSYDPIKDITDNDARGYVRYLVEKGYSDATINIKLAAIRTYYFCAKKQGYISVNPFEDIRYKQATYDDAEFYFLTTGELSIICNSLLKTQDVYNMRNIAMIMLMATEGLRTVEVHRMSDEDFKPRTNSILVHGKGRDSYIYPCTDTVNILKHYQTLRPKPIRDSQGTPTFIGLTPKYFAHRISRNGIRFLVNQILDKYIKRNDGVSCHMLRHSCGTNLYAATKDLRLVQETLRQKDPATTSRYAHVQERMKERTTGNISPLKGVVPIDFETY